MTKFCHLSHARGKGKVFFKCICNWCGLQKRDFNGLHYIISHLLNEKTFELRHWRGSRNCLRIDKRGVGQEINESFHFYDNANMLLAAMFFLFFCGLWLLCHTFIMFLQRWIKTVFLLLLLFPGRSKGTMYVFPLNTSGASPVKIANICRKFLANKDDKRWQPSSSTHTALYFLSGSRVVAVMTEKLGFCHFLLWSLVGESLGRNKTTNQLRMLEPRRNMWAFCLE